MKLKVFSIILAIFCVSSVFAQKTITNAHFEQYGNSLRIYYDLARIADISVFFSSDGGRTFMSLEDKHVSGDVGPQVQPGKGKLATWYVLKDVDKLSGNEICFQIRALTGKRVFQVGAVKFNMIEISGGTFTMGCTEEQGKDCKNDESPAHEVTLSDYYIAECEVTQGLWRAVMGSYPCKFSGNDVAADCISWDESIEFIEKMNEKLGTTGFRMPTEAEWEYAARGGRKSKGFKYSGGDNIEEVAWYEANADSKPQYVKSKKPNELGLYDMSGNVREWCSDWYGPYEDKAETNPQGPEEGYDKCLRGGGWGTTATICRTSRRLFGDKTIANRGNGHGLRLVFVDPEE